MLEYGLQGGGGTKKKEEEKEKFPPCMQAKVIGPCGAAAQKWWPTYASYDRCKYSFSLFD